MLSVYGHVPAKSLSRFTIVQRSVSPSVRCSFAGNAVHGCTDVIIKVNWHQHSFWFLVLYLTTLTSAISISTASIVDEINMSMEDKWNSEWKTSSCITFNMARASSSETSVTNYQSILRHFQNISIVINKAVKTSDDIKPKPVPVSICSPQIPYGLTWDQTRPSASKYLNISLRPDREADCSLTCI
jgi:hypothetical protein